MSIEIVEVKLADNGGLTNRGSRWMVKVNGQPVANYATKKKAERKVAELSRHEDERTRANAMFPKAGGVFAQPAESALEVATLKKADQ